MRIQLLPFALFSFLFIIKFTELSAQITYADNFDNVSYSNNDGTQNWAFDWFEVGDTDLGPTAQSIYISSGVLNLDYLRGEFIYRTVDLSAAISATFSFDYTTVSLGGSRNLGVFITIDNGVNWFLLASLSDSGTFSQDISAYVSPNTIIAFAASSNNWLSNDSAQIDNLIITDTSPAYLRIEDVTVNEEDGVANLTVTHLGADTTGSYTVDYTTTDGTAIAPGDYTTTTGTLSFNGTAGDTETISIPISDDGLFEDDETFTVQFTSTSNALVTITDTATVTIDAPVFADTPLALVEEIYGNVDYVITGNTLRTESNSGNACAVTNSSSNTLVGSIPATATIRKAYLYWAHSALTFDGVVTFEGQTVNADIAYSVINEYASYRSDVTSIINGIADPSTNTYDFADLTIDVDTNCGTQVVFGGWALVIIYEEPSITASAINLYQGFERQAGSVSVPSTTTFTLDSFFALAGSGAKASFLSWEGDDTISGTTENLSITNQAGSNFPLTGDGGQGGTNPYNSTIYDNTGATTVNLTNVHGLDFDTYGISTFISPGDTEITANVSVGQDNVFFNAVLLRVESNLITGTVFEDINYPGGAGRNLATSSGQGIDNVTLELYDNTNTLVQTTTSFDDGTYAFGGVPDGSYSVRVLNSSVNSTRDGGDSCTTCMPVQTFRSFENSGAIVDVTTEVGGSNPSGVDVGAGTLSGAQTVSSVTLAGGGIVGIDFGFNFNTIVNTNTDGQGSLEQFIVNSNNLGQVGMDIEANSIFDPVAAADVSIFMIPPSSDPLGRTADSNYDGQIFDIDIANANPLSDIVGNATVIDGRTQTAYSGDTNSGTIGASGSTVGVSDIVLPDYDLPEIQVHQNAGDVIRSNGDGTVIRNLAIYSNASAAIRLDGQSALVQSNLLGVDATGSNSGNIDVGIQNNGGNLIADGNYIATNTDSGIVIDGGSLNIIRNNHLDTNGNGACDDNILISSGSGIIIRQNLIENAASMGIDASSGIGNLTIDENTITASGQNGGNCSGVRKQMGIELSGSGSQLTNNVIFSNGREGIVISGTGNSNTISQNSMYANGTSTPSLGIDLAQDGVTLNDSGDGDSGPNGQLNFPIIESAFYRGSQIEVMGWAPAGATVEFFLTDVNEGTATLGDNNLGLSVDYGEGQLFIGSAVEGSVDDTDATISSYTDADGNTDNTNRFSLMIPFPSGYGAGSMLTATATLGGSTSEFSPMSLLKAASVVTNRRITYRVNPN